MKIQTKAIVASIIVIALAFAAISGVTYSWFSDTESSDIEISTAEIDISGHFTSATVNTNPCNENDGDTKATPSANKVMISNLLSNRTITSNYVITNQSTVTINYRMYVVIDNNELPEGMTITVSGGLGNIGIATPTKLSFAEGIAYIIGDDNRGVALTTGEEEYKYIFTISTNERFSTPFNSPIKVVSEAYQYDYTYSKPQVISNTGNASLPTTPVSSDITFKGTAPVASGTVNAVPSQVEITFDKDAINTVTDNGNKNVILKTEILEPVGSVARISLNLENAETSNFGDNWVVVSIEIPGYYTGLDVIFKGEGSSPVFLSESYNGSSTVITFKTNHFSEFSVIAKENSYANVYDERTFRTALGADVSNIKLIDNISIYLEDDKNARIYAGNGTMQTLDLNGKTLSILPEDETNDYNYAFMALMIDGYFSITGDGYFTSMGNGPYGLYGFCVKEGGHLELNGGNYYCSGTVVQISSNYVEGMSSEQISMDCTCTITAGHYKVLPFDEPYGTNFLLNYLDGVYRAAEENGVKLLQISGGTFVGYNPNPSQSESSKPNFLADGYKSIDTGNDVFIVEPVRAVSLYHEDKEKQYDSLQDAFNDVTTGDIVQINKDITLTEQVNVKKALDGLTITGGTPDNRSTLSLATTVDPSQSGGSGLYIGNPSESLWCTGITIENLIIEGKARFGIFLSGGETSTIRNVDISGEYYYAINFYGTHGGTLTNCKISNNLDLGDENEYGSSIWSNVSSSNPLILNNTTIDQISINRYTEANTLEAKIFIKDNSTVETIVTLDDGKVSKNITLCVETEGTGKYDTLTNGHMDYIPDEKTYQIHDSEGLGMFRDMINYFDDNGKQNMIFDGCTIELTNNIDLSGKNWIPIFQGRNTLTIDGKNNTIDNMTVDYPAGDEKAYGKSPDLPYGAGFISDGSAPLVVKNLTFRNPKVYNAYVNDSSEHTKINEQRYAGVVIGHSDSTISIENVSIQNADVRNSWQAGGFVGYAPSSCSFNGCSISDSFIGGFKCTSGTLFGLGICQVNIVNSTSNNVYLYTDSETWDSAYQKYGNYWAGHVYHNSGGSLTVDTISSEDVTVVNEYPQ